MVAAIGSAGLSSASFASSPTAGLEAQITRYQKQLADCVNCDSAKTAQGKENIQELSNKISAAKAKIEEINVSSPVRHPSRIDNPVNATAKADESTATTLQQDAKASNGLPQPSNATLGTRIDISA